MIRIAAETETEVNTGPAEELALSEAMITTDVYATNDVGTILSVS